MEKRNKLLYFDVMKGFLISCVIIGHSFLIVTGYMTSVEEKLFFSFFSKILSPCVFCFFYFYGYGQGLKRMRSSAKKLKQRARSLFVTYCLWSTFAWLSFQLLGAEYNIVNNAKGIFIDKPFTFRYLSFLFSFSGSWQYYFIFIFIVSMFFFYFFKNISLKALKIYLVLFSILQSTFFLVISIYLWNGSGNPDSLKHLGLFIYANPVVWSIPLFWGYYRAAAKKRPVAKIQSNWMYLLIAVVYVLAVMEIFILGEKWNGYYLLDQFTFFTLINSVLMIHIYDMVVRGLIKKFDRDTFFITFTGSMGRFSIIPFFVHLPYQWFLFVLLTQLTHIEFNPIPAFFVLSAIGMFLSYYAIKLIELLPVKIKRLLMGI